jgi:hypothetical protein
MVEWLNGVNGGTLGKKKKVGDRARRRGVIGLGWRKPESCNDCKGLWLGV